MWHINSKLYLESFSSILEILDCIILLLLLFGRLCCGKTLAPGPKGGWEGVRFQKSTCSIIHPSVKWVHVREPSKPQAPCTATIFMSIFYDS